MCTDIICLHTYVQYFERKQFFEYMYTNPLHRLLLEDNLIFKSENNKTTKSTDREQMQVRFLAVVRLHC